MWFCRDSTSPVVFDIALLFVIGLPPAMNFAHTPSISTINRPQFVNIILHHSVQYSVEIKLLHPVLGRSNTCAKCTPSACYSSLPHNKKAYILYILCSATHSRKYHAVKHCMHNWTITFPRGRVFAWDSEHLAAESEHIPWRKWGLSRSEYQVVWYAEYESTVSKAAIQLVWKFYSLLCEHPLLVQCCSYFLHCKVLYLHGRTNIISLE